MVVILLDVAGTHNIVAGEKRPNITRIERQYSVPADNA